MRQGIDLDKLSVRFPRFEDPDLGNPANGVKIGRFPPETGPNSAEMTLNPPVFASRCVDSIGLKNRLKPVFGVNPAFCGTVNKRKHNGYADATLQKANKKRTHPGGWGTPFLGVRTGQIVDILNRGHT
jgi:hypothetical protein